jgi:malate synthase
LSDVLTPEAVAFIDSLEREFGTRRLRLLDERAKRQEALDRGEGLGFLPDTTDVRRAEWTVAPPRPDLADRRVEITGPVDRKMIINALNSGARVFMADFEDSNSPTWENILEGQQNLIDAVRRKIRLDTDSKTYELGDEVATLMVRPRGWHLVEKHHLVDGAAVSASLFDFGLFLFHNANELVDLGSGPYFYLPKLESHHEARLWNEVFLFSQEQLGLPAGTIRATVLIETITAAFEMEEILYELREHSAGLNAGRWDYIFSLIKKFRHRPEMTLPDRSLVTMSVPFMEAYTRLLVQTCHRRGAHAMGGMSAFIPSRKDQEINRRAMAKVREDKQLEVERGHDGTWVAHPDLVQLATEVFDEALGDSPNQFGAVPNPEPVTGEMLLDTHVEGGEITERGLRTNVSVGIRYLASWLSGNGAAAIHNLMEDAATAEISRSQLWQWVRHGAALSDGRPVTEELVRQITSDEMAKLAAEVGDERFAQLRFPAAREVFERVALADSFPDFLTIPAYELID